jgi:hypothetical protein
MTLDQLVIALFVVIPLLEGLMRLLRRRTGQEDHPDKPLAQSSVPPPSSQLPERKAVVDRLEAADLAADTRPLPAAAPLLSPQRHAPERLKRRERSRVSEEPPGVRASKVARRAHERACREARLPWIGRARDLRPAIVLMTILGPCRALAPGDAPYTPP